MEDINNYFNNKKWEEIYSSYTPLEAAKKLDFKNGLIVAYKLLYNDRWEESLQKYAVKLLYALREMYPEDWDSSWRNDAFLGIACDILSNYDERYEAYARAYKKAVPPPPELLIELARCCICPGKPPISYDEAIALLEKSIQDRPYIDAIGLLKSLYGFKKNKEKEAYWSEIFKKIGDDGEKAPSLEPLFLQNS